MSTLLFKLTSNASITGVTSPDGIPVFPVYDFITVACKKNDSDAYARKTYSNLIKEGYEFRDEVLKNVLHVPFPELGLGETPAMTIRGLQRLLMILGGRVTAEFRTLAENTFIRVMEGDTSLIEVIKSNAASDEPINQERERMLFDLELRERLSKVKDEEVARIKVFASTMEMLNPNWKRDIRLRLSVENALKTSVLGAGILANTDGDFPLAIGERCGAGGQPLHGGGSGSDRGGSV